MIYITNSSDLFDRRKRLNLPKTTCLVEAWLAVFAFPIAILAHQIAVINHQLWLRQLRERGREITAPECLVA